MKRLTLIYIYIYIYVYECAYLLICVNEFTFVIIFTTKLHTYNSRVKGQQTKSCFVLRSHRLARYRTGCRQNNLFAFAPAGTIPNIGGCREERWVGRKLEPFFVARIGAWRRGARGKGGNGGETW